ncbi:MAG: acyl-CoA synthetase [Flavobacteriaceae bacterium]|nr:acyl-CoA synthetase [Flavobacteriaceae bacterium]
MIPLLRNAQNYLERNCVRFEDEVFTYSDLLSRSHSIASFLLNRQSHLNGARIAYLVNPGFDYVSIQWGIWRAGGIAVPLCVKHPVPSLSYVLSDTTASHVIYSSDFKTTIQELETLHQDIPMTHVAHLNAEPSELPEVHLEEDALILYTSGTTGNPKGVVLSHSNLNAQINALIEAWKWSKNDTILNVLPLHHIHGIVNAMLCPLYIGAEVVFVERFTPKNVFSAFLSGKINVFMAVPTIYFKLITFYEELSSKEQEGISAVLKQFRLMVSGSAALPVSVLEKWKKISSHILLERYGMTEIGMAISNPYDGERRPGHIGQALPGVSVKIVQEDGEEVAPAAQGEILVKGSNVFSRYWNKKEATAKGFTQDGWFKTGDMAVFDKGYYRILGRNSVDIIKSGGYKISALEIEEVLRKYQGINECAVVGIPDDEWGELIAASLIVERETEIDLSALDAWLRTRIPSYKLPRHYIFQEDLPRNVLGKVTKNVLKEIIKDQIS